MPQPLARAPAPAASHAVPRALQVAHIYDPLLWGTRGTSEAALRLLEGLWHHAAQSLRCSGLVLVAWLSDRRRASPRMLFARSSFRILAFGELVL